MSLPAHCAAGRRPQGTIRQRRIFGIGDASPRCRRRLGCTSHAQARGGSLLHHVPNRPPRFPTSTPPPGPSAHPSGFSIRSQRDYFGFNPTAFKAPVRTSVATEFNPGEHEYDTIPARHPSIRARGNFMLKRKAPFAILVALGCVGDADARRGGELDARAVIPLSPLPHVPPQTCSRRIHRHLSGHPTRSSSCRCRDRESAAHPVSAFPDRPLR